MEQISESLKTKNLYFFPYEKLHPLEYLALHSLGLVPLKPFSFNEITLDTLTATCMYVDILHRMRVFAYPLYSIQ